jgi:hypothetical protein
MGFPSKLTVFKDNLSRFGNGSACTLHRRRKAYSMALPVLDNFLASPNTIMVLSVARVHCPGRHNRRHGQRLLTMTVFEPPRIGMPWAALDMCGRVHHVVGAQDGNVRLAELSVVLISNTWS